MVTGAGPRLPFISFRHQDAGHAIHCLSTAETNLFVKTVIPTYMYIDGSPITDEGSVAYTWTGPQISWRLQRWQPCPRRKWDINRQSPSTPQRPPDCHRGASRVWAVQRRSSTSYFVAPGPADGASIALGGAQPLTARGGTAGRCLQWGGCVRALGEPVRA